MADSVVSLLSERDGFWRYGTYQDGTNGDGSKDGNPSERFGKLTQGRATPQVAPKGA